MQNLLLARMDQDTRERVAMHLDAVTLRQGEVVCDAGDQLLHIYFPQASVLSMLSVLSDGMQVETATIGHEGVFGALASLGSGIAASRCMVQVGGPASRIAIGRIRAEFEGNPHLRDIFVRYAEATLFQVQQSAACNALHPVEARLSRWLLEMSDRAVTDHLPLTHEFLAGILGANRTTVSIAAAALQATGCIRYRRGTIDILDRRALERACCECYASVRDQVARIRSGPA